MNKAKKYRPRAGKMHPGGMKYLSLVRIKQKDLEVKGRNMLYFKIRCMHGRGKLKLRENQLVKPRSNYKSRSVRPYIYDIGEADR